MTPDAIDQAVQTYFHANWTATPVFYENLPTPSTMPAQYVTCTVLLGRGFKKELGKGGRGKRVGNVKFQIFTPAGCGGRVGKTLGGQIEALFREVDLDGGVYFGGDVNGDDEPYTVNSGNDGTYQQHTTTCPFWAWTGE